MLDSSHHHGDFLSPPGGHSPDGKAASSARPTSETLARAADAVSHETPENPIINGVQQGNVSYVRSQPMQTSLSGSRKIALPVHIPEARRPSLAFVTSHQRSIIPDNGTVKLAFYSPMVVEPYSAAAGRIAFCDEWPDESAFLCISAP